VASHQSASLIEEDILQSVAERAIESNRNQIAFASPEK